MPEGSFHERTGRTACVSPAGSMAMHPIANFKARWIFGSMKTGTSDQVAGWFLENAVVPVAVGVEVLLTLSEYLAKSFSSRCRLCPRHPQLQFREAHLDGDQHRIDEPGTPTPKLQAISGQRFGQESNFFSMAGGDPCGNE